MVYLDMKNFIYRLLFIAVLWIGNIHYSHAQTVYVTENGKKFHAKNCDLVKTGKKGMELKDAVAKGFGPCAHCKSDADKPKTKKAKSK